jgi:hypothetical protein
VNDSMVRFIVHESTSLTDAQRGDTTDVLHSDVFIFAITSDNKFHDDGCTLEVCF